MRQVTKENAEYLKQLPLNVVTNELTLVHASTLRPADWTYVLNLEYARECFGAMTTDLCFIGHTHVPIVIGEDNSINSFRKGIRSILNVGSVGQPRDNNPSACFGFLDTEQWKFEIKRVPYNIRITSQAILDAGLPKFLAKRLLLGI
ncbi:MAG: hypothetical protein AAB393_07920 [Bacteroidota bacterium]